MSTIIRNDDRKKTPALREFVQATVLGGAR